MKHATRFLTGLFVLAFFVAGTFIGVALLNLSRENPIMCVYAFILAVILAVAYALGMAVE